MHGVIYISLRPSAWTSCNIKSRQVAGKYMPGQSQASIRNCLYYMLERVCKKSRLVITDVIFWTHIPRAIQRLIAVQYSIVLAYSLHHWYDNFPKTIASES